MLNQASHFERVDRNTSALRNLKESKNEAISNEETLLF